MSDATVLNDNGQRSAISINGLDEKTQTMIAEMQNYMDRVNSHQVPTEPTQLAMPPITSTNYHSVLDETLPEMTVSSTTAAKSTTVHTQSFESGYIPDSVVQSQKKEQSKQFIEGYLMHESELSKKQERSDAAAGIVVSTSLPDNSAYMSL